MCSQLDEAPEMKFNSLKVAALIAKTCQDRQLYYNNTKIQKLLYCCYGCALAELGGRLCDEYPRAWQFGPVFPRVFKYISRGGDILLKHIPGEISGKPAELIERVVEFFGHFTAKSLSKWSHLEGSPWDEVINRLAEEPGAGLGNFIPDDLIADYFRKHVIESSGDAV